QRFAPLTFRSTSSLSASASNVLAGTFPVNCWRRELVDLEGERERVERVGRSCRQPLAPLTFRSTSSASASNVLAGTLPVNGWRRELSDRPRR
ncbi:hypothetical protein, partial [Nocardia amikacinitolerans]|uniref:hypothetical protein n=1 Tax=Nocardia amikacinitolerans TaxID=756689 RepID=UPI001C3F9C5B